MRIRCSASPESRFPRLAPPSRSRPAPVKAVVDLGAVGWPPAGHRPPALLLDPSERRDVLVGAKQDRPGWRRSRTGMSPTRRARREPSAIQRAICRALPSRIAAQHRQAETIDLEEDDPGHVVRTCSPERRAMRCVTRSMYVSSSFVRKIGSRVTEATDATNAAPSAAHHESTEIAFGAMSATSMNIAASSASTSRTPSTSVNGRRSAASSGGRIAFRTAISAARQSARAPPRSPLPEAPRRRRAWPPTAATR